MKKKSIKIQCKLQNLLFVFLFAGLTSNAQVYNVLMFVSQEDAYYSEYIVMRAALEAAGHTVDLRSAAEGNASLYMIPAGTDITATANSMPGGTYDQFTGQFQGLFGASWDAGLNATPASVTVDGRIQDVTDMSSYDALVIVGGTGVLDYRVDGNYAAQGAVTAMEVQAAAEQLNTLALEALLAGKPVLGQCHGASIPAFWRVPGTSGPGEEAIGYSLLKQQNATGYPEPETPVALTSLDITHRDTDRVIVSSPHSSFIDGGNGDYKIITTQDWYPQTVAHAARTLLNVLETYPLQTELQNTVSVLIIHGGTVDSADCGPANRTNDIPCNYGNDPANLPADYTHLQALLTANSPNDDYDIDITEVDITGGGLPFDPDDEGAVEAYLSLFNTVIFFKHWSTGMTDALQNAIVSYADGGGGVLALHHGLYNDIDDSDPSLNKTILTTQLFGAEAAEDASFSAGLATYNLFSTNYGHFVSTYGMPLTAPALEAPALWNATPLSVVANASFSYYQNFEIYDEYYGNMTFLPGQTFGRGVNEITPVFSNDQSPEGQVHTSGFVKFFDASGDGSVGKVAYYQPGERQESYDTNHLYGQLLRNTVVWLASANAPVVLSVEDVTVPGTEPKIILYPNPVLENVNLVFGKPVKNARMELYTIQGILIMQKAAINGAHFTFDISGMADGIYFLKIDEGGVISTIKLVKN